MAAGGGDQPCKAGPGPAVHFVDTQRPEELRRALETISHALLTDGVSLYLSRPGSEHPFHHAVFATYLASGSQLVLHCADYGCCAMMGEVRRQQPGPAASSSCDSAAAEAAEAELARHAREERGEALERLGTQPRLQQLIEEHGAALSVHFIGTHPQRQGQGLGAAVLRRICALADERRLHSYLEASTQRSKARTGAELYARHGFVHVADKPLGGEEGAPVLRVMIRPPSSPAPSGAAGSEGAVHAAAEAAAAAGVDTD